MFTTLSNATSYKFYSTIVGAQWGALSLLECEYGRNVDHCIEKLEGFFSNENVVGNWNNITMESKIGACGFFWCIMCTSVPHGDKHIFIFIIEHKGVVYNIIHGKKMKEIQLPPMHLGDNFHSLNPLSFIFLPQFHDKT